MYCFPYSIPHSAFHVLHVTGPNTLSLTTSGHLPQNKRQRASSVFSYSYFRGFYGASGGYLLFSEDYHFMESDMTNWHYKYS